MLWATSLSSRSKRGTKYFAGNGGSAADAQHLAAEIVGRFEKDRSGLAAIAFSLTLRHSHRLPTTTASTLSSADRSKHLGTKAMCSSISTSGNSPNLLKAVEAAKTKGLVTIGLLGKTGGKLKEQVDHPLVIPSDNTARIQEAHILIGHILCQLIEESLFS